MGPKKVVDVDYKVLTEDELMEELDKAVTAQLETAVEFAKANALPGDIGVKRAKIALAARLDNDALKLIDKIKKLIDTRFIQPDLDDITNKATEVIEANADKPADYADKAVRAINIATGATVIPASGSSATGSSATGATGSSAITLTPSISDIYQPHAQYIVNLLLHQLSAKIQITNTVTDSSSNVTRTLLINAVDESNNTTTEIIPKYANTINIQP